MRLYKDIENANNTLIGTDIKGKNYIEVNQRIKAFRMVYPEGTIETEMLSNENGVCVFKAVIKTEEGNILATGTAYERENSTFINKTSYIENCETSAVGRALGMCGFGIDTSIASAEEVQNAINNQLSDIDEEYAKNYTLTFGKYNGKLLSDVIMDDGYTKWLLYNSKNEELLKCIEILTGQVPLSADEQEEILNLTVKLNDLIETTDTDRDELYKHYNVKSNSEMNVDQLRDAVKLLTKKAGD